MPWPLRAMSARLPERAGDAGAPAGCAYQQQAFAVLAAAPGEVALQQPDQRLVPGQSQRGQRFRRVRQAQQRQRQARLRDRAHRGLRLFPVRKKQRMKRFALGQRRDAHAGFGEDAEAAFGSEHHFAQIDAGGRGRKGRDQQRALGRLDAASGEQLLDAAVTQRLLAGRARGDPAAQRRILERLRKMTEGVALRAQLRLQIRTGDAGAEARQLRLAIEFDELRQPRQVDGEHRLLARGRGQVAGDAGAAAVGNHRRGAAPGVLEQFAHLLAAFGKGDAVGHDAYPAVAQLQPVGQALAEAAAQPRLRRGVDQAVGWQPAGRDVAAGFRQGRILKWPRRADALLQKRQRFRVQRELDAVIAPPVPASHL